MAFGVTKQGLEPSSGVFARGRVAEESERPVGRVLRASGVAQERSSANGSIAVGCIGKKRPSTDRSIQLANGVAAEREETNCRIEAAAGAAKQRILPFCGVAACIAAIRRRAHGV